MVEVVSPNCVFCWSGLCKCNLKVDIKKRKNRRKKNLNIFIACVPTTMLLIFMPSHSILLGSNESHFAFTLSIRKLLKILTKNKQRTWMAITIQTFFLDLIGKVFSCTLGHVIIYFVIFVAFFVYIFVKNPYFYRRQWKPFKQNQILFLNQMNAWNKIWQCVSIIFFFSFLINSKAI